MIRCLFMLLTAALLSPWLGDVVQAQSQGTCRLHFEVVTQTRKVFGSIAAECSDRDPPHSVPYHSCPN